MATDAELEIELPESFYPLSPMQQGMLFHSLGDRGGGTNICQVIVEVPEAMDASAFEKAWQSLAERHEILRASFRWEGLDEPVQQVQRQVRVPFAQNDWQEFSHPEQKVRLETLLSAERRQGFEPAIAPLMRVVLIQRGPADFQFVWTYHHILLDARSLTVLLNDLFALYEGIRDGKAPVLPPERPYRQYLEWVKHQDWSQSEGFWREKLKGFTTPNQLLTASAIEPGPNSSTRQNADVGSVSEREIEIPEALTSRLRSIAQKNGLTLNTFAQGAWALLLSRYCGEDDVVFGAVRACRHSTIEGAESMAGLFINTLPVRVRVRPEMGLIPWLTEIRQQWVEFREVEHTPLVKIQAWSEAPPSLSLFETIVNVQDPSWDSELRAQDDKWAARQFRIRNQPGYPLALDVYAGQTVIVKLCYQRQRFDEETMARLLGHFRMLMEAMAAGPEQNLSSLPMLTKAERRQLLMEWNDTEAPYPKGTCVHELFEAQAERTPDGLALSGAGTQLTYRELNRRANQLARQLRDLGLGPEMAAGVCAEPSVEMVIAQLAIWKAGAAFVPIDPAYPAERVKFMIEDAGISILLGQQKLPESLPEGVRFLGLEEVLRVPLDPEHSSNPKVGTTQKNLAYVIYTSGSTGRPKGVEIEQAGFVNLLTWHQRTYGVATADRATQLAGPAFDASVWEIWPYLTGGASVHIPASDLRLSPKKLLAWLAAEKITICFLPTPLAEAMVEEAWPKDIALTTLLTGGDRLHRRPRNPLPCKLINHYGPTESTVVTTAGEVGAGRESIAPSIGRPIANTKVYLLDRHLQVVPMGVPGELHIGGVGLARGYRDRPELTAEKFIPNPFSQEPGDRLYKTGDRARYLPDGQIEFLGRIDQQVKIRGYRIEPGEIESVLRQHPSVREAAVLAREDFAGENRLVAYLVPVRANHEINGEDACPSSGAQLDVDQVRHFLKQKLPDYMVPSIFVRLNGLPLTPNGKLDRNALPKPDQAADLKEAFVAPRTPTEEMLAGMWMELLHLQRVGVHDNFFHLGGHSLLATQVISRVRSAFALELSVQSLFDNPTVATLAEKIDLERGLGKSSIGSGEKTEAGAAGQWEASLSFAQERLWFLEQLKPGEAFNNIPAALRVRGALDAAALKQSLDEIVRRHQVLRTAFRNHKGTPAATVSLSEQISMPAVSLAGLSTEAQEMEARRLAEAEARQPFDLSGGLLLRVRLLKFHPTDHLLLITTHHMVSDGWSMGIFYRELGVLYEAFSQGRPSPLPELPLQYADFAGWQRQWMQGERLEKQVAYWSEQLKGRLPHLELPTDRPRPAIQTYHGATRFFSLPSSLHTALKALSRREDVTLYMVLLAAFQTLLHRYSGQADIILGSPIAGRTRSETETLMGLFLNTLVLRTDLSGNPTFRELLKRVRKSALEAYAHQDLPFEKLVESLRVERDLSRSPLFQVMFVLQNAPFNPTDWAGLNLTPVPMDNGAAKFDLTLSLEERSAGLSGSVEYNTDLFDSSTILRLLGHFQTLLETIVKEHEQPVSVLQILTEGERCQLLVEWNNTLADYPKDKCIHQLFEEQVERTPNAIAAVFEEQQLTYRELNERADQVALHLQSLGAGPEVRVGICLHRSLEMLVGLLGVLKSGGCYLPLDPAYPKERLAFMLEDSQASVVLSQKELAQEFSIKPVKVVCLNDLEFLPVQGSVRPRPKAGVTADNVAYVIYTSGSTGKPKGVMITHRNVANFFAGMDARLGGEPGVWLAVTSISFDISVLELFWTLTRGFKVVIQGEEGGFRGVEASARRPQRKMDFSLFYFESDAGKPGDDKYKLLTEGAKFADQNGLTAVWTPERHFHPLGGLYPNPAVTGAALAMITQRVQIRGGSVVLPLHSPIRIAEEWALVDNLSKGRAAISIASGWHPGDFVLAPGNYARRKEIMLEHLESVRKLWRGEPIQMPDGEGHQVEVRIFPKPIQRELPIWMTSAGAPETFRLAGEMGANLLTHLFGQSLEQLSKNIEIYRAAWRKSHPEKAGRVSLMLPTFVWDDADFVWEMVRQPFHDYLRTYRDLSRNGHPMHTLASQETIGAARDPKNGVPEIEALLNNAADRYLGTSGLFGTPAICLDMIEKLKAVGVDEVACLVDFGVEDELVLRSLRHLNEVKEQSAGKQKTRRSGFTLPEQLARHGVTHLQCTPSLAGMLVQDSQARNGLRSLQKLLLGGEALPPSLVKQLRISGQILNMYGPTETTVWSSSHEVTQAEGAIPIGRPITNTEIYILDRHLQPVPVGIPGELLIGGAGVARGYLNRPELTNEKFIGNPFNKRPGARLYRTGDLARFLPDGTIDFIGRVDQQVKLRGFRIELSEIESVLCEHPLVREAVVVVREFSSGDKRLVAYLVPRNTIRREAQDLIDGANSPGKAPAPDEINPAQIREFLKGKLPDYMVPSAIEILDRMPLTPNGKVDRKILPEPAGVRCAQEINYAPPQTDLEKRIATVWQNLLHVEQIGRHDNFFDLGGHSLLVVQAHTRLCEMLQSELSIIRLFQYPTISALTKFLTEEQTEKVSFQGIRERARKQKGAFGMRKQSREILL